MAEQRFDIVVTDKVSKTIRTELTGIGESARGAYNDLRLLNSELANQTAAAAARAQSAAVGTATATARLSSEQAKLAVQTARTTAEQHKANAAYLREEAALNRAVAAEQRAIASRERAAAASAKSAAAADRESAALARLAETARQEAAQRRASSFLAPPGSGKSARDSAAVFEDSGQLGPIGGTAGAAASVATITAVGNASRLSAQYAGQLGMQLNDVFVSLASGQAPMTVFLQQGAQVAQLPAQAGMSWREFGTAALNTLGIFTTVSDAALDAAAAQAAQAAQAVASVNAQAQANIRAVQTEIALATAQQQAAVTATEQAVASVRLATANEALTVANAEAAISARALATAQGDAADALDAANARTTRGLSGMAKGGLAALAVLALTTVTVGALTREANKGETGLRRFSTEMGYTAREVEELNSVSVGFGDTFKAVFEVGARRIAGIFGLTTDDIRDAWNGALDWMANTTVQVMARIYAEVAGMAYGVNNIIQNLGDGNANDNPFENITRGYIEAYQDAITFFDDVRAEAQANARGRQDEMAARMASPRSGRGRSGGREFDRAGELARVNRDLDMQVRLLQYYGDELERQSQLEQINRTFRENGVELTRTELELLDQKLRIIQEGTRVQQAMTAAEEAANGPAREYEATQEALNRLLQSGAISTADYTAQMRLATRAFDDAVDPLAALNRELQRSGELMGLYGRDRDVASYIQQLEQAAQAQGRSIFQTGASGVDENGDIRVTGSGRRLTPDAQAMVDEYRRQQQQDEFGQAFEQIDPQSDRNPGSPAYILDNHRAMYEELQRLREQDVLGEEEAARRKQNLDRAVLDARLEHTGSILGQISQLQNSKNRELAALGKAAAIAQATIDGYRAVQAALVGPPGPPWSFAIAGVTAAMTAANVAKIAGVGFMSGGYTGDGPTSAPAGIVHGREFVFDAQSTSRIGVGALESARRAGSLTQAPASGAGATVVIKPQPGVYIEERRTSTGEIELIAERVARRVAPKAVADDIGSSPNSRVSRAMSQSFRVERNR